MVTDTIVKEKNTFLCYSHDIKQYEFCTLHLFLLCLVISAEEEAPI